MKKYIFVALLSVICVNISAQFSKVSVLKPDKISEIYQVDYRENSTIVYVKSFTTVNNPIKDYVGIAIHENTYARINGVNKKYHLINCINLPITSDAETNMMLLDKSVQEHCYALEFEKIPKGVTFDIIEKENIEDDNFYGITPDTTQIGEFVNLDKMVEEYPLGRIFTSYIKNDNIITSIKAKGIAVSVNVQTIENYGKYYQVMMDLQNFSGKSILFSLDNVTAEGLILKDGKPIKTIPLEILSSYEYDKKVSKMQSWGNFWATLGESLAASNAGYSTSETTYNGTSNTSLFANAYGYIGNTYGYLNAYGNAFTTSYGKSHSTSYNGAAAYAAQQIANERIQRYSEEQYRVREQLNEGYVKTNTIRNQVEYSGFFNVKFNKKIDLVQIVFRINGIDYTFHAYSS